ncbi:ABC transporter substrate-binding protein [Utexia brackfieldae]|uniref:heme/hemin ABC transporter substrate-binding protein n=1 Tax=Utexia brackfieldae TaxID=3074108 RepID=UPI00370D97F8
MMKSIYSLGYIVIGLCGLLISYVVANDRIVTSGGSITEIVYALQAGDRVVGVDMSSTYPPHVKQLPQIGYWKQLSIEGLLSLKPTIFIGWDDSGPAQISEQLKQANIQTLYLKRVPNTLDLLLSNVESIGKAIDQPVEAEQLIAQIKSQVAQTTAQVKQYQHKPTVLFLLSMAGATQVAGKNTVVDSIIQLAGGENIAQHANYKNYSAEAFITANPAILIVTTQSLQAIGGLDNLANIPGLTHTQAWQNRRIIAIDQALILGMGPRVGEALTILAAGFYPSSDTNIDKPPSH